MSKPENEKPQPIEYTIHEAGRWLRWEYWKPGSPERNADTFHAVRFADGSIFDTINGWREPAPAPTSKPLAEDTALKTLKLVQEAITATLQQVGGESVALGLLAENIRKTIIKENSK